MHDVRIDRSDRKVNANGDIFLKWRNEQLARSLATIELSYRLLLLQAQQLLLATWHMSQELKVMEVAASSSVILARRNAANSNDLTS